MRRILVTTRALNIMFTFDIGKIDEKEYAMWRKKKIGWVKNVYGKRKICVNVICI